jgi:hypothetical protein
VARLGTYADQSVQRLATEVEREFRRQDSEREKVQGYLSGPLFEYLSDLAASVGFTDPPRPPW